MDPISLHDIFYEHDGIIEIEVVESKDIDEGINKICHQCDQIVANLDSLPETFQKIDQDQAKEILISLLQFPILEEEPYVSKEAAINLTNSFLEELSEISAFYTNCSITNKERGKVSAWNSPHITQSFCESIILIQTKTHTILFLMTEEH